MRMVANRISLNVSPLSLHPEVITYTWPMWTGSEVTVASNNTDFQTSKCSGPLTDTNWLNVIH